MANKRPGPKSKAQLDALSIVGNEEAPITLFLHCQKAYELMFSQARRVVLGDTETKDIRSSNPDVMIVWEGMLTRLIVQELNLSVPYYTSITRALKNMGCIRQLRRGGGTSPSQWELLRQPDEQDFKSQIPKKETKPDRMAMIEDQISALNNRILLLEDMLEQALKAAS